MTVGSRDYRALVLRVSERDHAQPIHLVREDAEAALCGIPRGALGPGAGGELVCSDCIEWFVKRRSVSGRAPRV